MAGIRIGTLYTENRDLVEALAQLGAFHGIPGTSQYQVAQLLKDRGTNNNALVFFVGINVGINALTRAINQKN